MRTRLGIIALLMSAGTSFVEASMEQHIWDNLVGSKQEKIQSIDATYLLTVSASGTNALFINCADEMGHDDYYNVINAVSKLFPEIRGAKEPKKEAVAFRLATDSINFRREYSRPLNDEEAVMLTICETGLLSFVANDIIYTPAMSVHRDMHPISQEPRLISINDKPMIRDNVEYFGRFDREKVDLGLLKRHYSTSPKSNSIWLVRFSGLPPFSADIELDVDINMDCAVIATRIYILQELVKETTASGFTLTQSGVWYPAEFNEVYYLPKCTPPQLILSKSYSIVCDSLIINDVISPQLFDLSYDEGSVDVLDYRMNPPKFIPASKGRGKRVENRRTD